MSTQTAPAPAPPSPSFIELYVPKLVTVLREGYSAARFRADALSGLTVAIVALPLSMAIAIASGATPGQGLITAIVGGFLVSALGGSRFQIGGPAGAFIVLVAATVQAHGMDGLTIAVLLSGLMLVFVGLLQLGTYIKFIPYPVTVGFTAGIAVTIFASQIKPLLGLTLTGPEPGELLPKLVAIQAALPTFEASSFAISAATVAFIIGLKRWRPKLPGMLIAVAATTLAAWLLKAPAATIGSQYGSIADALQPPHLPAFSLEKVQAVLPNAISFTLLGSIESLLSAVVADGMTGRRHRSNCELIAQGAANIGSALFGGICVTGTIARTATNVRAGATSPVSGMMHSAFVLAFVLIAAPLAAFIPLASLAGVLAVVSWNMVERQAIWTLLRSSPGDAAVLLATFGLTIFRGLTEAIVVGFALGSVLFIHRMSKATAVDTDIPLVAEDQADRMRRRGDADEDPAEHDRDVIIYRLSGALFFGAAASIGSVLDGVAYTYRELILDFSAVPFVDSTAAHAIESIARKASHRGARVHLTGTSLGVRRDLIVHGLKPPLVHYATSIAVARGLR